MDTTALIVWQSYLQASSAERHTSWQRYISPDLLTMLQNLSTPWHPENGLETDEDTLSKIHFSWLSPFLRSLPENDIRLFIASLSDNQIQGLKKSLLLSNFLPELSDIGKAYLRKTLFQMMVVEDLIPTSCLPEDPLNTLAELNTDELISMIDLLSMHDLSVEIRQIIETTKLKEINSLLSKAQAAYLKTLMHKKEQVTFKKMGLLGWNKDAESLRVMLVQRGINRIAKALYGKNPSLIWHIAHHLDVEKAQLLQKLCTPLDHPRAQLILTTQVIELAQALKKPNPPETI